MNELTVVYGNQRIMLQPGQFAHIGRRNDNAVVINDPRVSREHLRVSWDPQGGGWKLENLGQAGTFVSGQPVTQLYLTRQVPGPARARPVRRTPPDRPARPAGPPPAGSGTGG